ncbi:formin-G-like isoform X2 [Triticum urartu]|uniref:formin-G-like isoform X2 n=1 Tax=Triticum urartu TaxID=4572 RepID=UPI002044C5B3|nr:formin-G-like isoform X2 [Triticum urartu]XP_048571077.1 formin-G-like isoform X2 [Triticum urartu]XP_048571079.1 formin-G-like isoform X2 [Triticum urartu]XP_048571080.1 formin-G-like isoform X2 [Triticum urartu]XP_048571081.1 formin-G-like isoform X2 [Triticum urartu]XP_048571083.1 formin-G-like isoform X2 [Triticum urartu]XP_048571085.1 formin-G-like isoform X2 [Triticum urartu]XP_048571086.1 formin-G-like isoform X2 [Triticum urartu]
MPPPIPSLPPPEHRHLLPRPTPPHHAPPAAAARPSGTPTPTPSAPTPAAFHRRRQSTLTVSLPSQPTPNRSGVGGAGSTSSCHEAVRPPPCPLHLLPPTCTHEKELNQSRSLNLNQEERPLNRMVCRSRRVASASVSSYLEVPWSKACEDAGAVGGVGLIADRSKQTILIRVNIINGLPQSSGTTKVSSYLIQNAYTHDYDGDTIRIEQCGI